MERKRGHTHKLKNAMLQVRPTAQHRLSRGQFLAFVSWAAFLATTKRTIDLWVRERYVVVLPSHFLLLSVAFLIVTFVAWKFRVSR
jgi:hypothetical protein